MAIDQNVDIDEQAMLGQLSNLHDVEPYQPISNVILNLYEKGVNVFLICNQLLEMAAKSNDYPAKHS